MMSKIQWTEKTWNPIAGCSKVSPGCKNCYAETMGQPKYQNVLTSNGRWNGNVAFWPDTLSIPERVKKPTTWFVNSMSDLFHVDVEYEWLKSVWAVMANTPRHTYQILTKRPFIMSGRVLWLVNLHDILPNVWLGTSVENQGWADERIPYLLETPAAVRFLSMEPLLGPVDISPFAAALDWVIVGGESGPNARPMSSEWVRSIRDQCQEAGVAFFFKQWGEWRDGQRVGKKVAGRLLDDVEWSQMPLIREPA